jgi:hypothetical protein
MKELFYEFEKHSGTFIASDTPYRVIQEERSIF